MTIGISLLGQAGLTPLPGDAPASGRANGTGGQEAADFASLIEAPDRTYRDPTPAAAFDALGMFGRFAIAHGAGAPFGETASHDPALSGAAAASTALAIVAQPLRDLEPTAAAGLSPADIGSVPAPTMMPAIVPNDTALAIVAGPIAGLARGIEEGEAGLAEAGAPPPSKAMPDAQPQPVSAMVALENGALQVILRSSDPGLDHSVALRNRIEELARELDLSIEGVRLNGVALLPASSGAAYGRRPN